MWSLSAGYVLVGGRSTRMGSDKALIRWAGDPDTLAGRTARAVRDAAGSVTLIGDPDRYAHLGYPVVADLHPGLGPLAGVEAALAHTVSDWNLIAACDLPRLDSEFLRMLLNRRENVVAADSIGPALCAVLHRDCRPVVEAAIRDRRLSWHGFLDEIHAVRVAASSEILVNINTPKDLATHE